MTEQTTAGGKRIHVLGVCGTFMGGLAELAIGMGYEVEGSDQAAYPPMSDQLEAAGIKIHQPYAAEHITAGALAVVGNALTRGNPAVEHLLNTGEPMVSGPAWLAEHVLRGRTILAVSGTHGKTTTASMLAWILDQAGLEPGFLIGGVPRNFGISARLGKASPDARAPFIVEADEYDSAFFDKRSKFVHYRPRVLVINNIEFDHADIFDTVADIRRQFHHVVRTVPSEGALICPSDDPEVDRTLKMGCWTPVQNFGSEGDEWTYAMIDEAGSKLEVSRHGKACGRIEWDLIGHHNARNALGAIAAACTLDVTPEAACEALGAFAGVKRRLEVRGTENGVTVYDDFAHHPSAISVTLEALRAKVGSQRILAVLDPASNTMRAGVHADRLGASLVAADAAWVYATQGLSWDPRTSIERMGMPVRVEADLETLLQSCAEQCQPGDHVLIMSNSGFGGAHLRLLEMLRGKA